MSSKRNKAAERAARAEALRKEQARKERQAKITLITGVVVVLALVAAGIYVIARLTGGPDTPAATPASVGEAGAGEFGIMVGDADAETTITLWEDLQCPICGQLEGAVGDQLATAIDDGTVRVDYRLVSFLDQASTNDYSSRAMNAALAVLDDAGIEGFRAFHKTAFDNQPAEGGPGPEDDQLIQWAVDAGADEAVVTPAIEDKVYEDFISDATDAMNDDGVSGTPTAEIDGERIDGFPDQAILEAIGAPAGQSTP